MSLEIQLERMASVCEPWFAGLIARLCRIVHLGWCGDLRNITVDHDRYMRLPFTAWVWLAGLE